ncbi:thymidine phosphorylase [soil metagenome]
MTLPQDIIRHKRDGLELTTMEIETFIQGATSGLISEGQIGAFLMAVYLKGMCMHETVALALAMRDSGRVLDWEPWGLADQRLVEKHSSGGVGDEKITLIVAPLAAACGVHAPNISARGLDFTPGEVDLLDSIPGYNTAPGPDRFRDVVRDVGCAIIGPTPDLAPADRKLYFVRDVTATVESVPLITSSIMSKKLASGAQGYVICVGSGSGAFMPTLERARELAAAMGQVASDAGVPSVMLLTNLDVVLGTSVGNAVAVAEAVDFLTGEARDSRVQELVLTVAAEMAVMAGVAPDIDSGRLLAERRLLDGSAAERFERMVAALGGPVAFISQAARHLPGAPHIAALEPETPGFVIGMDAGAIGRALVALGGGRRRPDDDLDLGVGFTRIAGVGDEVGHGRPLCLVHARDEATWVQVADLVRKAFRVGAEQPRPEPMVLERLERRP